MTLGRGDIPALTLDADIPRATVGPEIYDRSEVIEAVGNLNPDGLGNPGEASREAFEGVSERLLCWPCGLSRRATVENAMRLCGFAEVDCRGRMPRSTSEVAAWFRAADACF